MYYQDLEPNERRVLAGLVRLMVRMDGVLSPDEIHAVTGLARDIGAPDFWTELNNAQDLDMRGLAPLIEDVRAETREWMYGALLGLAAVDGIEDGESELLAWLMSVWDLHG